MLSLLMSPAVARAAGPIDLRLDLPDGSLPCVQQDALEARIAERVRAEGLPEGAGVHVRGELGHTESVRLQIHLSIGDEDLGTRELSVSDHECESGLDAVALVVVIALRGSAAASEAAAAPDDEGETETLGPAQPPPVTADRELPVPATHEPAMTLADEPWPGFRIAGELGALVGSSGPPAVTAAVAVDLLVTDASSIRVIALGSFPSNLVVADGQVAVMRILGRLAGCLTTLSSAPLALEACGFASVGLLHASARGFARNGTSDDSIVTLGGSGRLRLEQGALFAHAEISLGVNALRPELIVRDDAGSEVGRRPLPLLEVGVTTGVGLHFR